MVHLFFFFFVYIHMCKNIYYGSYMYPRQSLWFTGCILWLLMIMTAFLGYILPWGQMSVWGAVVITNIIGSIPFIGTDILYLLWGGWSLGSTTLKRFYAFHFFLSFVLVGVSYIHVVLLHEFGSNNPLGITAYFDGSPFVPYYIVKDIFYLFIIIYNFCLYCFFSPDFLNHVENFVMSNTFITPAHIVPEWYFLPIYAILRSIPNKGLGIFFSFFFVVSVFLLPFIGKKSLVRSATFRPIFAVVLWFLFFVCLLLGWVGGLPVYSPFAEIGMVVTFLYFFILFIVIPIIIYIENIIFTAYLIRKNQK